MKNGLFVFIFYLLLTTYNLLLPHEVGAVCPVCTVAVAGGLGLSRWLGIDDSITGIWVGGLIVSLAIWTADWLKKKRLAIFRKSSNSFLYRRSWPSFAYILSSMFYVLITYPPLYWAGLIGHPYNTILRIDKLIFGSATGALFFLTGVFIDNKIRKLKGKQLFNYQKVTFPVASLVIASLLVYYYGGYLQ